MMMDVIKGNSDIRNSDGQQSGARTSVWRFTAVGLLFLSFNFVATGLRGQEEGDAVRATRPSKSPKNPGFELPDIDLPTNADINQSIRRGVAFLLADQNANGSWGSPTRTKDLNIFAPVPGAHHAFRAATTSLCLSALLEVGGDDPKVIQAIERGEQMDIRSHRFAPTGDRRCDLQRVGAPLFHPSFGSTAQIPRR